MKPRIPTRKPRGSGGERRAEILAAAERIFFRDGYQGATVRKIAQEVGVSATTLYMHFPDKRAMLMEIGSAAIEAILAESERTAAGNEDPVTRIRALMMAHMRFALEHQPVYKLVWDEASVEFARNEGPAHELASRYYRSLIGVVRQLSEAGRLHGRGVHTVGQALFAGCHGVVIALITNPNFGYVDTEDLKAAMIDGLIRGLID